MELAKEFALFVWEGKRFWLLPILAAILLVGVLAAFSESSTLSPFIYPFF